MLSAERFAPGMQNSSVLLPQHQEACEVASPLHLRQAGPSLAACADSVLAPLQIPLQECFNSQGIPLHSSVSTSRDQADTIVNVELHATPGVQRHSEVREIESYDGLSVLPVAPLALPCEAPSPYRSPFPGTQWPRSQLLFALKLQQIGLLLESI